jgi:uncharacterized damage-inducible protein DinB
MTILPDAQQNILARYIAGPTQLEAAITGLSEHDLDAAPAEGGWSIRQIAHHIVDGDDIWKVGIKAALGNGEGEFDLQWYWGLPQDTWAERWRYADRDLAPSLALFRANRDHVLQLLREIPDAWMRSIHLTWLNGEREQITVGEIIEMQARHALGHINDILVLKKAGCVC